MTNANIFIVLVKKNLLIIYVIALHCFISLFSPIICIFPCIKRFIIICHYCNSPLYDDTIQAFTCHQSVFIFLHVTNAD